MYREQLEKAFCRKLGGELKLFKYRILKLEKEEIFALAYRIDCMQRIYEILTGLSETMEAGMLKACIRTSGLMELLYGEWLKIPDSQNEELELSLCSMVRDLTAEAA